MSDNNIRRLFLPTVNIYGGSAWVVFLRDVSPLRSIERSCDASLASFGFRRTVCRRGGAEPPLYCIKRLIVYNIILIVREIGVVVREIVP